MRFTSKTIELVILGITATLLSRGMLVWIDDPEGPNLLIVMVLATFVYIVTLPVYRVTNRTQSHIDINRLLRTILAQLVVVVGLYFCLSLI